MSLFTRTAADVFAPTDAGGSPRGADMGEAQTWGTEVEAAVGSQQAVYVSLAAAPYNLVLDDSSIDQASIIQQAIDDHEGTGVTLVIPSDSTPTIGIGTTINMKTGVTLQGGNGQGGWNFAQENFVGAKLAWLGADGVAADDPSIMVKYHGIHHANVFGIMADGNGGSNVAGFLFDSDNSPTLSLCNLKHWVAYRCHVGAIWGDPSDTAVGYPAPDANAPGAAEADTCDIEDFTIIGDGTDLTAKGIHINGQNVQQLAHIRRGIVQKVNIGYDIISTNGQLKLQHLGGGAPVGTNPEQFKFRSSLHIPPMMEQCETEGSWTYGLHDSSAGASDGYAYPTLAVNCNFNNDVLIDGQARFVSICNYGASYPTAGGADWTVGGNAFVLSIMDGSKTTDQSSNNPTVWQTTGSGRVGTITDIGGKLGAALDCLIAGVLPSSLGIGSGEIATIKSATSGRMWLGSDGVYFERSDDISSVVGAGLGSSVDNASIPSSVIAGYLYASSGATSGRVVLGGDNATYIDRSGNNVNIVTAGNVQINGSDLLASGGAINNTPIGATTPSTGKFTTLAATGQVTVTAGTGAAPSIQDDTNSLGIYWDSGTGFSVAKSNVLVGNIGQTGFNSYRSGAANVSGVARTDNHGNGATIAQLALSGTDANGASQSYCRFEGVAVTATAGAMVGRLRTYVQAAGSLTNVFEFKDNGVNVVAGSLQMAAATVIDSNRNLNNRSYTIATLPTATAGVQVYCSDLGGGGGILGADGTGWSRFGSGGYATVSSDAAFSLVPLTDAQNIRHTGTLTADRSITLSTTNARPGARFRVTRTGSGAFNLSLGGLKNLATNTWAEAVYDGSAWYLSQYGAL